MRARKTFGWINKRSHGSAAEKALEAGSVIRKLAASDIRFAQGGRAAARYKVESGRLRLVRRTVDDRLDPHRRPVIAAGSLPVSLISCGIYMPGLRLLTDDLEGGLTPLATSAAATFLSRDICKPQP